MNDLLTLKVWQEVKDGRLETAIIMQLVEDNIIDKKDRCDVIVNFFRKNNRANGKSLVQIILDGAAEEREEYVFEVKNVFRFNTKQVCTLSLKKPIEWGNYLPM